MSVLQHTFFRPLVLVLTSLWLCCSCIDPYEADLPSSDRHYLVIEGSICGQSTCTFYLGRSLSLNPTAEELINRKVNDARLTVCGSNLAKYAATRTEPGVYQVTLGQLNTESKYWVEVEWEGRLYKSEAATPLHTPDIEDLHFEQPREDEEVDILITPVNTRSGQLQYYHWDYVENWEVRAPYSTIWEYNTTTKAVQPITQSLGRGWCEDVHHTSIIGNNVDFVDNEIHNLRLYSVDHLDNRFNHIYCTTVTQRAITREQFEYEQLSQRQSDDMGGLFTPQPSELPSNIFCSDASYKAIGYIGVTLNAVSRRLYITRKEAGYRMQRNPMRPTAEEVAELGPDPDTMYKHGFRVLDYQSMTGEIQWIERWGVDVTAWGAKLTPPDFWPY